MTRPFLVDSTSTVSELSVTVLNMRPDNPNETELQESTIHTKDILEEILALFWGLSFDEISLVDLVQEEDVKQELKRAILSGRLSPGTSVTITELAERLGVSLMPVRQALKSLEAKNLIRVLKNRRLVVRKLSVADLEVLWLRLR